MSVSHWTTSASASCHIAVDEDDRRGTLLAPTPGPQACSRATSRRVATPSDRSGQRQAVFTSTISAIYWRTAETLRVRNVFNFVQTPL